MHRQNDWLEVRRARFNGWRTGRGRWIADRLMDVLEALAVVVILAGAMFGVVLAGIILEQWRR